MCKICSNILKEYGVTEEGIHFSPKTIVALRAREKPLAIILHEELDAVKQDEENQHLIGSFKLQIEAYKAEKKRKEEAEERAKYPHEFGGMSDLCIHCGIGYGWFGSNVGKPCDEHFEDSKKEPGWRTYTNFSGDIEVKNDKTPPAGKLVNMDAVDVVLHLTYRVNSVPKMTFRTLSGDVLPSGSYRARIVDIKVDKQ